MSFDVIRKPGDKPAPPITSSLLKDDLSKIERGRSFINENDSDRLLVSALLFKDQILDYNEPILLVKRDGSIKGGIITDFELDFSRATKSAKITTKINLECIK